MGADRFGNGLMRQAQINRDAQFIRHAEIPAQHEQKTYQSGRHIAMGESFDHRFCLQDPTGETLQKTQADTGVRLDGSTHRGGRCGHHFHPREGNSVVEAI